LRYVVIHILFLTLALNLGVAADAAAESPFTIIRASMDGNGMCEIHQFSLLSDNGPPRSIEVPAGAQGLECSVLEYALFRARFTLAFEGALREGLASEYKRRERIKNASELGAILYCLPLWPVHLFWELPFTGIEKEQMLQLEGYTLQLPVVETSFSGERPLALLKAPVQGEEKTQVYNIEPFLVEGYANEIWRGAGLHFSYYLPQSALPSDSGMITISDLLPGYPEGSLGTVLLLIDIPENSACDVFVGNMEREMVFSSWPGNYDWPLGIATYVLTGDKGYIGIRQTKMHVGDTISFGVLTEADMAWYKKNNGIEPLRTDWLPAGSFVSRFPFLSTIIPPAIIAFLLFHLINFIAMRINYRKSFAGAIFDPIISHLILLVVTTIFAPFFGLGWILGAYVAGRFLQWRHPEMHRAWLSLLGYALAVACVYEGLYTRMLWI
jgi:hypothetical protein